MGGSNPLYAVGVDGSDASKHAARFAAEHARETGARILLINITPWSPYELMSAEELSTRPVVKAEEEQYATDGILAPLAKELAELGVEVQTHHSWGHESQLVVDKARDAGAQMIFVGRTGRSRFGELVIGSIANSLVHLSPIPVVVVP